MSKRVLDVGNCPYDHAAIRRLIEQSFAAEVIQAHAPQEALDALRAGRFDLMLINRRLVQDRSDGVEIIRQMKADPELANVPVMLITNYPDHQQRAVEAGAEPGFGKARLDHPETRERLRAFLGAD